MNTRFIIFIGFLALYGFASAQIPDSLKYISLQPADFQKSYQDDTGALLIDVREFFEYKKSRIDSAVNIPSSDNLDISADTLNKESSLFLYCTTGYRSKRVSRELYDKGFLNVYNLDGGISAWKKAGLPVNKRRIRR